MEKIKIENFGPVAKTVSDDDGFLAINRFTIFIGEQGSGKSTIVKLYSTLCWLEKDIARNCQKALVYKNKLYSDLPITSDNYSKTNIDFDIFLKLLRNQNIPIEYAYNKNMHIVYKGDCCEFDITCDTISMKINPQIYERTKSVFVSCYDSKFQIEDQDSFSYKCPKITYIPSERNVLSVVPSVDIDKIGSSVLLWTKNDVQDANNRFSDLFGTKKTILGGFHIQYDKEKNINYIKPKNSTIKTSINMSSSGLQSYLPLILILANSDYEIRQDISEKIKNNKNLISSIYKSAFIRTDIRMSFGIGIEKVKEEPFGDFYKNAYDAIAQIVNTGITNIDDNVKEYLNIVFRTYLNSRYVCIIEEPEQNLFPSSQIEVLNNLIHYTSSEDSKCVITTHSPHLLNFLNNYIYAGAKYISINEKDKRKILKIVDEHVLLKPGEICAYELKNGSVVNIFDKASNLIDSNLIDEYSIDGAEQFDRILEI